MTFLSDSLLNLLEVWESQCLDLYAPKILAEHEEKQLLCVCQPQNPGADLCCLPITGRRQQ